VIVGRTGHVWGERYRSEILAGDPPEWAKEVDWEMVEEKAKTEIPAGITYELSWDSPRYEEIRLKMSASRKNPPKSATPPV
jgi:electron transfer flavoprotein alpha/beta subunit